MLYTRSLGILAIAALCGFVNQSRAQTTVILISIDTLRADHVGAHTPNISAYGEGGTVFANAETQIPFTLPSHTVLMTSTYPFQNGVEENAGHVPPNLTTLATVLKGHGYQTAAFIGSIFLERQLGLDQGFDTYDSPFSFEAFSKLSGSMLFAGGPHNAYSVRERRPGALVLLAAKRWMAAHKSQPVFVFVHLFDVHRPYQLGSYDAEVASVDQLLGGFAETLKREGWWDKSLVVVTADHGEGLGEHGESDHGYFVYESTLHVPLIMHWPAGAQPMPARVEEPIGIIDVAPTVLDFLKIRVPGFRAAHPNEVFSESTYGRDCFGWAPLHALRAGQLKYIDAPRPELYNLAKDPKELTNLIATDPADAAKLRAQLAKLMAAPAAAPAPASGDPQRNKAVLESLGYLAPGPRAAGKTTAADPKDKLPELLRYEDALNFMAEKRYDLAIAVLRKILTTDPGNLLARRDLGVALIEKHEFTPALQELQRVVAASGDDYVTRYELGVAQEGLGHLPEALTQFEAACRIAPAAEQCKGAIERVRGKVSGAEHPL
jgi:arylsulfatase A-like enzyme